MRPCAVQFDAQKVSYLSWSEVRDSEFVWDFDDGGSRTDSEGFLAAVVYEHAGTHRPTVTVDGETWNPETITVRDPSRVVCVGNDFSGCPSASSADRFSSLSSAWNATTNESGRHILLERGGSHSALPDGGSTPTMIGAYGTGARPVVTADGVRWTGSYSFVDLEIRASGSTGLAPAEDGGLLLRSTGTGAPTNSWMNAYHGAFVVDSSIVSAAPYTVFPFDDCPFFVIKNSTIDRTTTGQHTVRIDGDGQEKILIQNSQILGAGAQHALTIRGTTRWLLIQGNFFDQQTGTKESQPGDSRLQEKIVFERNAYDRQNGNTGINWGFTFQGRDMVVRNNIVFGGGGQMDYAVTSGAAGASSGIWLLNNTSVDNDTNGIRMNNCSTCKAKNNLVYSTNSVWGDCITQTNGVDVSHNWCFTNDECLDPVDGDGDCYDPRFMSMTRGDFDFVRPAPGTRGIDQGDGNVPVWNDFDSLERKSVDIGAVER